MSPVADTVTTASLADAVSARLAAVSVTVGATSAIVTVNVLSSVDKSALVALTVTVQLAPVDSRSGELSTVTIPVEEPTANIPAHDCAVIVYVTVLVVPSASDDDAVTPTVVPEAEFSCTVFEVASVSDGAVTSNSSTSLTLIVTNDESESPDASAAVYATISKE